LFVSRIIQNLFDYSVLVLGGTWAMEETIRLWW